MNNITNIQEKMPHLAGEAKCLACKHEWAAVAPIGATELDCPKCELYKGVFKGLTIPEELWQCDCGNEHFYISPTGSMCARCGLTQAGYE